MLLRSLAVGASVAGSCCPSAVVVVQQRSMSRKYYAKPHPPGNWRIVGATILERPAQVLADSEPWEAAFKKWQAERAAAEKAARGGVEFDMSSTLAAQYQTRIGRRVHELDPTPRETEADRRNNVKSLRRALQHRLFLVVKKNRSEHAWQFPQTDWQQGQTIRQTAEAALKHAIGDKLQTWYVSEAPAVHVEYWSSPEYKKQTGYDGTKVFFLRAYQLGGPLKLPADISDFAWLKYDELAEKLAVNTWDRLQRAITPY